jgi:predicted neuraminidase
MQTEFAAIASLLCLVSSRLAPEPKFDGVIRPTGDGRNEAYMIPPYKTNHASFLELLPSGELVMAWFSGTAEGANNCSIVLARLPSRSQQWSKANLTARRNGYSNQNPVLFYDNTTGVLYLYHSQQIADPH